MKNILNDNYEKDYSDCSLLLVYIDGNGIE